MGRDLGYLMAQKHPPKFALLFRKLIESYKWDLDNALIAVVLALVQLLLRYLLHQQNQRLLVILILWDLRQYNE